MENENVTNTGLPANPPGLETKVPASRPKRLTWQFALSVAGLVAVAIATVMAARPNPRWLFGTVGRYATARMERDGGALVELLPLKVCYLLCAENGLTSGQLDTLVAASMAGDDYASLWRMADGYQIEEIVQYDEEGLADIVDAYQSNLGITVGDGVAVDLGLYRGDGEDRERLFVTTLPLVKIGQSWYLDLYTGLD